MSSDDISPVTSIAKVVDLPNREGGPYSASTSEAKKSDSSIQKKILFVFATTLEAQAFGESEHIVITGMGPEKVREALKASVIASYDEIWNIGFAGAIDKTLPIGSIHQVATVGSDATNEVLPLKPEGKRLITFDKPLRDPSLRNLLSQKWDLVDMEGHTVAEIARAHNIPCHLIKIVSDNVDANTTASILENAPKLSALLREYILASGS